MIRHPVLIVFAVLLCLTGIWHLIGAPIGLITQIAIYTLYGAGVCMLVSYTGLVPFGASVFFGCASYAVAFVMLRGAPNEIVALIFCVGFSMVLAAIIAIGIGAHNFGEGLAIGASAASGATAIALALIVGFGLHNATEGFGVAAPMVGRVVPSWAQIGLAGLVAGGPTFVGTIVGYTFYSPTLSVLFLAIAIGALVFVIGELWSVLRRTGLTASVTATMCAGFLIALATELFLDINGG